MQMSQFQKSPGGTGQPSKLGSFAGLVNNLPILSEAYHGFSFGSFGRDEEMQRLLLIHHVHKATSVLC